jgi:hypothetical protein
MGSFISGKKSHLEKVYLKNSLLKPLLVFLFFFLTIVDSLAQENEPLKISVKDSHISADIRGAPLVEVVKELSKETGIRFTYTNLPEIRVYSKIENQTLEKGIKDILPLNTVFVHSDMLSIGLLKTNKTIKSIIILSSLKRNHSLALQKKNNQNASPMSEPETSEQSHRHNGYQTGIGSLTKKVEESVVAYHWLSQLKNPDFLIRLEAIRELGQLGSDTALQALYLALGDKNETVREEAQYRLKEIDSNRWFNSIEEQLTSANPIIQNSALDIIQTQKGDRWVRLLEASEQNQSLSLELREKAAKALQKIKKK